ncbi:hypothetical protein [Nosocomiicoccus ampullae]|uniref:EamA domain-containing membrane protein RarD n=1 Tax=Nosocomiicoccus ampullae TaxID=489910 RepID=A0A9Q2CYX8_9STAP|nr:hypothetical protein [Nosocomiicoccus ampullae]MBB5175364.1 EamA domain-containing membrane protein RarD [Nosocomiicoccus ampullae]QYA46267.1 hypothetical protein KPF49_04500 [Nosocomiicoccus ampullae]
MKKFNIGYTTSTYRLLLSGAVIIIPLLLFSVSAKKHYIFIFKEQFSMDEFIDFTFIWIAMILYIYTKYQDGKIAQRAYDSGEYARRKEEMYD